MVALNYLIGNFIVKGVGLELVYATEKNKVQCTSLKEAKKLFGGNVELAKRSYGKNECFGISGYYQGHCGIKTISFS